jgi:hypothetical protein
MKDEEVLLCAVERNSGGIFKMVKSSGRYDEAKTTLVQLRVSLSII